MNTQTTNINKDVIARSESDVVISSRETKPLVPQLRFSEFESAWVRSTIGEVCSMKAGSYMKASQISGEKLEGMFPCYGGNGLRGYTKSFNKNGKFTLIGRQGAHCGNVKLVDGKFHATEHAVVVSLNNQYSTDWIYYLLYISNLNQYATGQAQPGLSVKGLESIKINFPTLPEQQKIASFLTAVDAKLQQLTKKKELLQQYKKGVMQQLFSQKLRFKPKPNDSVAERSRSYPDWEEKKLKDIIEFKNGKAHEQDIDEEGQYVVVNSKFISRNGEVRKYCKKQVSPLYKGDIVMVMSDIPNGKALAKCILIDENDKYSLNQRICGLSEKDVINEFLIYILNRNRYYLRFDSGVGQTNLKKGEVLNCPLFIPSSKEEQQQIASYLSALDTKIKSVAEALEATQRFKKGLLQQLFV